MRTVIAAAALAVWCAPAAEAQEPEYGFKVGPSFSTLALEPEESGDYGRRIGASGGAFAVLPLSARLALQVEALYAQKGGKLEIAEVPETAAILLGYVELPVLLRVGGPRAGGTGVHFFAGAAPGFRATARRQLSEALPGFTTGVSEDISDEIRFFELTGIVGAGFEPHRRIVIDGRYSWGLTHVNKDTEGDFYVRTRTLTIMLGVRLPLR